MADAQSKPKHKPNEVHLSADPNTDAESARLVHMEAMLGGVYMRSIGPRIREMFADFNLSESAMLYARQMLERMAPRDPMEEMLISQALLAHARVMHLTSLANSQERLESIRTIHEYADRASNTYRRLMLALAEYRKPPKAGDSYTAIGQANIAGQQVVVNGENKNATNEQGCDQRGTGHDTIEHDGPADAPQALPAEPRGPGIPPSVGSPDATVGAVHRPEDG